MCNTEKQHQEEDIIEHAFSDIWIGFQLFEDYTLGNLCLFCFYFRSPMLLEFSKLKHHSII